MDKEPHYKIAAVDIGSNAMRAVFAEVNNHEVSFIKNYRWPLRLGADVFKSGKISQKRFKATEEAFGELFLKLSKHNIERVNAVATSAMRDSSNGKELASSVKKQTGIEIEIIDGEKEAQIVKRAVSSAIDIDDKMALMIDIGGGSAEVTLTNKGKNLESKSFDFGTVRIMESAKGNRFEKDVENFSKKVAKLVSGHRKKIEIFVGTGGNLRRMGKLRKLILGKSSSKITLKELEAIYMEVESLSIEKRMKKFDMRRDRADVIVYAMTMIVQIMSDLKIKEIKLPRVGLKEGIVLSHLPFKPSKVHLQIKGQ